MNGLAVFDHFVGLAFKGLNYEILNQLIIWISYKKTDR